MRSPSRTASSRRLSTTTPAPSPITNPSAPASKGRHSPRRDSAPMRLKHTRLSGSRFRYTPPALARASLVPGVLQGGAHAVEQQPVLRVGHLDPPWSDPVVERGELAQLLVGEEGALVDIRLVGNAGGRVVEPGMVPARRRDGPE